MAQMLMAERRALDRVKANRPGDETRALVALRAIRTRIRQEKARSLLPGSAPAGDHERRA